MITETLVELGLTIRRVRNGKRMSLKDVATRAHVSPGLLSKIENYRTIPSLPVLLKIALALGTEPGDLLAGAKPSSKADFLLTRKEDRLPLERESARGFQYYSLIMRNREDLFFESFILKIGKGARRKPVTTDGDQFMHILKGGIRFKLGKHEIVLKKGDSIYFDGRLPHVPYNSGPETAEVISVYLVEQKSRSRVPRGGLRT